MGLSIVQDEAKTQTAPSFSDFWTLWPKRVARLDAEKAWRRMTPDQQVEALVSLCSWRALWIAEGRMQFVPHASTWLNGCRWEDELPEQWLASHASHLAAKLPDTERSAMPDHVRALIARLRK